MIEVTLKTNLINKLMKIQNEIAKDVIEVDNFEKPIKIISGIDIAFLNELAIIACVSVDSKSLKIVNKRILTKKVKFPYISGFLSFREGPLIINMINYMDVKQNIFLINAQGIAHPRFCGCASYIGVIADKPTIGVTVNRLCGTYHQEPKSINEWIPLFHRQKIVGVVLKTQKRSKPIFISPGHKISLKTSICVVTKCISFHKLPIPLYYAHKYAKEEKRKILNL
jgi:deoxyribonuclease V